ncbi:MAG: hypothetical protein HUJ25_14725 [Crocinitomicaceae bacterium]|nr:hypothetical protein [Crocinitomicaceae bacterium]
MKKIVFMTLALVGLVMISCNKDQSAVKKLDGTWKSVEQDGSAIADSNQVTYTFMNCKLKTDEYCDATGKYSDGTTENFEYKVSGDGTIMSWKTDDGQGNTFELPATIDELTKTNMTLTFSFIGTTTIKYEKQ